MEPRYSFIRIGWTELWLYYLGMGQSLDEIFVEVWRQAMAEDAKRVVLGEDSFAVRTTAKQKLRQLDFRWEGRELRGLEQNPTTKSRWAGMARAGQKVMQFLEGGRYLAVVADGKVFSYKK